MQAEGKLPGESRLHEQYTEDDRIFTARDEALSRIVDIQQRPAVCVSNCTKKLEIIPDEQSLLEIAREIYPYGVESDTQNEKAAKTLNTKRFINKAMSGDKSQLEITLQDDIVQMTLFDDYTVGASAFVDFAKMFCRERLNERGYFYLDELYDLVQKPPFGAYECCWYIYLLAISTRDLFSDKYRWLMKIISCSGSRIDPINTITGRSRMRVEAKTKPFLLDRFPIIVYVEDKSCSELARLLCKLFEIPEKPYLQSESAYKHIDEAIPPARTWCENHTQTPLAWIDDRFREIFAADESEWCRRGAADKYLEWLKSNFDDLYRRIRTIDTDFDNSIIPKYGEKRVSVWRKRSYVKGSAAGWLWGAEDFVERVENYMEKTVVCRECGRYVVNDNFPNGYEEQEFRENGDELWFTSKDIIGLNRKLINEKASEFYCLHCLCEYFEASAEALYDKIQQFKEEGCTLFA